LHFGDHPIGLLILKSSETKKLAGLIVGAAAIPNLKVCQSHQIFNGNPVMKLSFANKKLLDYLVSVPNFIPKQYLETGFLDQKGYAIGACSTLSIRRCHEYFELLHVADEQLDELFPIGGAAIAPQPRSIVEEEDRRHELCNLIEQIKSIDQLEYEKIAKDGRKVQLRVRIVIEEMETRDNELLEKLLCYRVLESN
jgi:hypothetical protein